MRRWSGWIAIASLLFVCVVALLAYGNPTSHPSLDDRTRDLAAQLRCPVCQGESVADSPSVISKAMRHYIRVHLAAGQSPHQIKNFFVAKYGERIVLAPPDTGVGDLAWFAPPVLLLAGLGLLLALVFDWRRGSPRRPSEAQDFYLERVRAELAADSSVE